MEFEIIENESIKKFRHEILDTVERLEEQLRKTEQAMTDVASILEDLQFQKYHQEFSYDKEKIPPLCRRWEDFANNVLRPLQQIEVAYL